MEGTLDIEFLGPYPIIKELALVSDDVIQTFLFRPPYPMNTYCSKDSDLSWSDGHIPYDQLHTVLTEITANFDHLYADGSEEFQILNLQLTRPIHKYEDLNVQIQANLSPISAAT